MSASLTTAHVVEPRQLQQKLLPLAQKGGLVLSLAVTLQYVGQWRLMGWVFLMSALRALTNVKLSEWLHRRYGPGASEWGRLAGNVLTQVGIGLGAGWTLLLWIFIPFNMFWFYGVDGRGRLRAAVYLVAIDTVALLSGADPFQPLAFSILGVLGFLMNEMRADLQQKTLEHILEQREQLSRTHGQLRQLHERALEQEKFSSLGMMAAGVAHEINNPMAYVTSNVQSLLKDLRRQPALSEPLKEYVEDVLPATLDGIKRVNSIVSDLRRFARGDPETSTAYELNEEAKVALRIAQGQLNHLRVEVELGEVGQLVGRPRQIVQVLVNLLVNAGQATPEGGLVRLSTHREGDGVRVEVHDTGMGMTPETRRNLFQPFFTTKAPGTGMGLGLAVAHGIVTGQGGSIEVRSEPGQGSCFTVRLPRVAPMPAPSASRDDQEASAPA